MSGYDPQIRLIASLRTKPELWRLAVGLVIASLVVVALNTLTQRTIAELAPEFWVRHFPGPEAQGNTPASMLITLFSFGFLIVGVDVALRSLHGRGLATLIGPLAVGVPQFARVLVMLCVLSVVLMILPPYQMGMEVIPNLPFGQWLALLPFAVTGVLIQSASEEILFRGYVQQQLAARFQSPLVWMLLPSALFAVGHYLPSQAGENAVMIALWSGLFGVLMADLTARAGSLGPAIAVHLANNFSALLIVALPDSLSGLALYVAPVTMDDVAALAPWMPVEFATTLVFWLAARLAIRR